MDAAVRALFIKLEKGSHPVPVESVEAVAGGFEGDWHTGSSGRRQILLISGSVLDELCLAPGAIHENVVIDGLDVMRLKEGQELQLGAAVVSITIPCEPCVQMDRIRYGLQDALRDRRGMFVTVVVPGTVRAGDRVVLREANSASNAGS